MTAMPEMVSMFNGMGGACAALISIVEFNHLMHQYRLNAFIQSVMVIILDIIAISSGQLSDYFTWTDHWIGFICRKHDRLGKIKWKSKGFFI